MATFGFVNRFEMDNNKAICLTDNIPGWILNMVLEYSFII